MSKFKNIKIGAIVLVSLFILVWGLNFLKGLNLFKEEKKYNVVYNKVGGLENSTRVMLNGYQVGQVNEVSMNHSTFNIHVGIVLSENIRIPLKSVARIASSDLMGTKEIQLILYDTSAFHNFGDTLQSDLEKDLREEVNAQIFPLRQKAEALMLSFDSLLGGVQSILTPKAQSQIAQIFKNINLTVASLETVANEISGIMHQEKGSIASIIRNVDSISTALAGNTQQLNNLFNNLSTFSDSLSQLDIAGTIREADLALRNVHQITDKVNTGYGSLGLLLNDTKLYSNLEKASKELELLLKDLRHNPKRYVHYSVFGSKTKKTNKTVE